MEFVFANAYDASKPLFAAADSSSAAPKITKNSGSPSATSANQTPSTTSIAGNWAVAALFNIPLPSTPYNLTITSNTIKINGGCNSYTY